MRCAAVPVVALLLVAPARHAWGETKLDAMDLFLRGRELRTGGDCAGAIPLFRRAWELYPPGLGSLRNIAECDEVLHMWTSARRNWSDLKQAVLASDDPKYDGWDADSDEALARVSPKIARLGIVVVGKTSKGEATLDERAAILVRLNDEPLDRRLLGTPLDRDPGVYRIRVEGGKRPLEETVQIAEGEEKTLTLRVDLDEPSPLPFSRSPPGEDRDSGAAARAAGWASVGVGGAALVAMGVSLAIRQSALSQIERDCPGYASAECAPSLERTADRGRAATTLANVFGALGVLGVGVGLTLVVTHPHARSAANSPGSVALIPLLGFGEGGAAIVARY